MSVNRRELLLIVGLVSVLWLGLMLGLAKWQRGRAAKGAMQGPELPHFPGTEAVSEQTVPHLGWRKYWFTLNEEYPSKSVFHFYRRELARRGWELLGGTEPQWQRQESEEEARDLLRATWLSADRLFQIDVEMASLAKLRRQAGETVSEERQPGIRVYVTLRRVVVPGMILPGGREERARPEIELP